MRKTTQTVAAAFVAHEKKHMGNTSTDGQIFRLYGNAIAQWRNDGTLEICLASWNTNTTKERINGILQTVKSPLYLCTIKGQLSLYNTKTEVATPINSRDWFPVEVV